MGDEELFPSISRTRTATPTTTISRMTTTAPAGVVKRHERALTVPGYAGLEQLAY